MRRQPKQSCPADNLETGLGQQRVEARSVARAGSRRARAPCVDPQARGRRWPAPVRTRPRVRARRAASPRAHANRARSRAAIREAHRPCRRSAAQRGSHSARNRATLASGVKSMKDSSTISRPPCDICVAADKMSCGPTMRPSGLLGLTITPTSASASASNVSTVSTCAPIARPTGGVLGIGEAEDRDAFGRENARKHLNEGLRAAAWNDVGSGGRAIGPARGAVEGGESVIVGKPRENLIGKRRQRIGARIDARRQIDPGLRRVGKKPPRGVESPAMRDERRRADCGMRRHRAISHSASRSIWRAQCAASASSVSSIDSS